MISAVVTSGPRCKGDLHVHSNWSDGSAPIEEMMLAARELGHEYCALTDHSPRLKVANGLSPERLRKQLEVIDELRETVAPMRILTGIEVDILEDGSLDQEPELLERLDVVVASVHSKLSMDAPSMTRRMIKAVNNPHADVLGHCTGRLVTGGRGIRPESKFDAEKVFTACRDARHRRRDQLAAGTPGSADPLLNLALEIGCLFSIDTDSHAPGQLEFLGYGAQRALDAGVPVDRIVNTWSAEKLLEWTTELVGQVRHLEAGVAAEQHAAGQRGIAVALAHFVDRLIDRDGVARVPRTAAPAAARLPGRCWTPRTRPASGRARRSAARPRQPDRVR